MGKLAEAWFKIGSDRYGEFSSNAGR